MNKFCKSCKYLFQKNGKHECRRYAPAPVVPKEKNQLIVTVFPTVDIEKDWCGEYEKQKGKLQENITEA